MGLLGSTYAVEPYTAWYQRWAGRRHSGRISLWRRCAGLVVRIHIRYASVVLPSLSFTTTAFGVRVVVVGSRW